ncbi:unnamed protein product [Ixodes persulcatus]
MRWGTVPHTPTSGPIVSRMTPTSPMAPHWMARPGGRRERSLLRVSPVQCTSQRASLHRSEAIPAEPPQSILR